MVWFDITIFVSLLYSYLTLCPWYYRHRLITKRIYLCNLEINIICLLNFITQFIFISAFQYNTFDMDSMKFICPNQNCGKSYKYKPDLNRHLKSYCGKEPNFVCLFCYKRFMRKDVWKNHLALVHKSLL